MSAAQGVKAHHPCIRLSKCSTVNQIARLRSHPGVDHLDFVLASNYNHHTHWMVDKPRLIKQYPGFDTPCMKMEYVNPDNKREEPLKNIVILPFIHQEKYRNSTNHMSISLPSHHLPSTERGYGRRTN